jgi:translation initiation factor 2D
MWKKPWKPQKQNLIKTSDKRRLKEKIAEQYPKISKEQLDLIIPQKGQITTIKVGGESRTVVYCLEKDPIFFDIDGREKQFIPTVYTLWRLDTFLPTFVTPTAVFRYISSGADLMLPGVIAPDGNPDNYPDFKEGDIFTISFPGYPKPYAVGLTQCSKNSIKQNGMTGRALRVLHSYPDNLWKIGSKEHLPPPSEQQEEELDLTQVEENPEGEQRDGETEGDTENKEGAEGEKTAEEGGENNNTNVISEGQTEPSNNNNVPAKPEVNMDELIEKSFFQAIKKRLKDKDLPILASTFYSKYLLPSRPAGTEIDIKKSCYKQLRGLLDAMVEKGVIKIQSQQQGVIMINQVNRESEWIAKFRTLAIEATAEGAKDEEKDDEDEDEENLAIKEFYQIPKDLSFLTEGNEYKEFRSLTDCNKVLWDYIAAKNLNVEGNARFVSLDTSLLTMLSKSQKQDINIGSADMPKMEKKQLALTFKNKLVPYYEIIVHGIREMRKGTVKSVVVTEDKRGRHVMTHVVGLEHFGLDPKEIAKACSKKFAVSATTAKLPGKDNNVMEVLVQGKDLQESIGELIETQYKIPAKYIDVVENKQQKKK